MANVFEDMAGHAFETKRKASFSKLTAPPRDYPTIGGNDSISKSKVEKMWKLMETYLGNDNHSIQRSVADHVEYSMGKTRFDLDPESCYRATALSIRDRLIECLNDTSRFYYNKDMKRCYYLSLEFLMGRAMQNALVNMDIEVNYKNALDDLGHGLEELYEYERDAALGNGGLGRLAACFLDSMATLNFPCMGYGIRYTYGIFEQKIANGYQLECPDYWLMQANPWEIARFDCTYAVRFYGHVKEYHCKTSNRQKYKWVEGTIVQAMAYDHPIPGFDTFNTNVLRLWKALPAKELDLDLFSCGRYIESVKERLEAETISAVLYPNDNTYAGKELRLKQQYFFVCATIQDALRRFKKRPTTAAVDWSDLPNKMCCQLNDTHPTIAIPELMRILIDVEGLEWDEAWGITKKCFNYTNHTVLPEALEKWPAALMEALLPRHILLINDINYKFLTEVRSVWGDQGQRISNVSIYEEGYEKKIRMANLAVIGSSHVNGVAAIHTDLVKKDLFPDFVDYYTRIGETTKFLNVTNGVTPRRWIHCANPQLSRLISAKLGSDTWLKKMSMIRGLLNSATHPEFQDSWAKVKRANKERLAKWVEQTCDVKLDVDTMLFDIQVKRIHEYKRQLLNCLYICHRYLKLKSMSAEARAQAVPRACMIGGKAAPGYAIAKTIIKLCSNIAKVINNDRDMDKLLKLVFLPNYNVSSAQIIIPASDLSQHISTAGTEASGTSNMKFCMNGGLIIGTLDGANVELREEAGDETMFLFGAREEEVERIREKARSGNYPIDGRLMEVFNWIRGGHASCGESDCHGDFCAIVDRLLNNSDGHNGDYYLLCHDFPDYCRAQEEVDETYKNPARWWELSIKVAGASDKFSTDRTINEYATKIWNLTPCERLAPDSSIPTQRSFANEPSSNGWTANGC